jgi:uncharacterized RDD family membrane protein YckC
MRRNMIYLWNINRLKSNLAIGSLSKRQSLIYFICILVCQIASWVLAYSTVGVTNLWDNIDTYGFFFFLIIGTIYCYHGNGSSKGKDFLSRYVSLAWVFGVRYTVMVIIPLGTLVYLPVSLFAGAPDQTQWYDDLFEAALRILFYLVLAGHIRDVAMNRVLSEQEISELEAGYDQDFDQSKYPTILRRYLASSIDVVFILTVFIAFFYMLNGDNDIGLIIRIMIGFSVLFLYEPVFTSRLCTIGQKITGIRVRKADSGKRLSIPEACLRTVVKLLLGLISFFSIPVTRKRRALHDFAAGSVVIYAGRE